MYVGSPFCFMEIVFFCYADGKLYFGGGPFTYEWNLGGTVISTEEDVTGLGAGEYFLTVTDADDCSMVFGPFVIDELVSAISLEYQN